MRTIVSKEALCTIVDEVTSSMLGQVSRVDRDEMSIAPSERWTGFVDIGSPPRLLVSVQCRGALAATAATRMVGEGGESAAVDALGELTSMISGNVKSLLSALSGAPLGSPVVELGEQGGGDRVIQEVHLRCGEEPLTVVVSERGVD